MAKTKKIEREEARFRLAIAGELTIYRAQELKQTLLDALEAHTELELDLSQVSELDSAGLQLLLFAKQSASARRVALTLVEPSPAVREVFALLQLAPDLSPLGLSEAPT
jgi:anti-sigma B factor antagonist